MRLLWQSAIGLLLSGVLLAQTNPANGAQSQSTDDTKKGACDKSSSGPQIRSDTKGFDFNPYLTRLLREVKEHWYELIPESAANKRGKVVLEFSILKDGSVARLRVVESSGDVQLDRPAYGSITGSNPFPLLPKDFSRPSLAGFIISPLESTVAVGSTMQFRAVENDKDAAVTWSIIACDDACGTLSAAGLYTAPLKIPPSKVRIGARLVSSQNYSAEATVTVIEPKRETEHAEHH